MFKIKSPKFLLLAIVILALAGIFGLDVKKVWAGTSLWLGQENGILQACDATPTCTNYGDKGNSIGVMAFFSSKLWLGDYGGALYSCDVSGSCTDHGDKGGSIYSLTVFEGKLWLGHSGGRLSSCDSSGSCANHGDKGYDIRAMAVFENKLWLGHSNGRLSSCDSSGSCTDHEDKGYDIRAMAVFENKLWLGHYYGYLSSCNSAGSCTSYGAKGNHIYAMTVFENKLWLGEYAGLLYSCTAAASCTNHGDKGQSVYAMDVFDNKLWLGHYYGYLSSCISSGSCTNHGDMGYDIYAMLEATLCNTCEGLGKECGSWDDGCGGSLECGDCGIGEGCADGICELLPAAPSGLSLEVISYSEIDLAWTDNSSDEEGFYIHRVGIDVQSVEENETTYPDTGLNPGTNYCYYVTAYNAAGESEATLTECATTLTNNPPLAPSGLQVDGQTNPADLTNTVPVLSAIFNDNDTGDIANKYRIQINTNSDFLSGIRYWDSGSSGTAMPSCNQGARCSITYASTSLDWATTYYWRIKFWDDEGNEGAWSTESAQFSLVSHDFDENFQETTYKDIGATDALWDTGDSGIATLLPEGICYLGGLPQTTAWGANLYDCVGADKRCYNGECKICGGWLFTDIPSGTNCWYAGGYEQSCDAACATHGGCVSANWNDDASCTVLNHFFPCANCLVGGWGSPLYSTSVYEPNYCYQREFLYHQECNLSRDKEYRACVCEY